MIASWRGFTRDGRDVRVHMGQAMPVILQDLRNRLREAGVETKLGFPRMVENLCWGKKWRRLADGELGFHL